MYEALVARIRYHIQKANFMGLKEAEFTLLLSEAADAIEELSRLNAEITRRELKLRMEKPRWIPVTERLPEERINPNTRDFEHVLCATIWGDVRPFKYGTPIGQKEAHFWNGAGYVDAYVTHWMLLPEPPEEET